LGRTVEVAVEADILPDTPVAVTAGEIGRTVREVTEGAMGLRLRGKPRVRIKALRLPDPANDVPLVEPAREDEPAGEAKPGLAPPQPERAIERRSPPQS
jgi:hypothetical protein